MIRDGQYIISYFLGELAADEEARLEAQCFNDEDFANQIFIVEDELIDAYTGSELSDETRRRFERFYLTTDARRERVALARALRRHYRTTATSATTFAAAARPRFFFNLASWRERLFARPLPLYALGIMLLGALLFGVWWSRRSRQPIAPNEARRITTDRTPLVIISPTPNIAATPTPAPVSPTIQPSPTPTPRKPTASPPQPVVAFFTLRPGVLRDENAREQLIKISPTTSTVALRFVLPDSEGEIFRAELHTSEGATILTSRRLIASNINGTRAVTLRAPASLLPPRDYLVRLFDERNDPIASYIFRVERR